MPYGQKSIVKKYFTIGEVAKELRVTTSSYLFFWGTVSDLKKKQRQSNYTTRPYLKKSLNLFT